MNDKHKYEDMRLILQGNLDSKKTQEERNRLGQFATPSELARDILAYGLRLLPTDNPIRFLDPAVGTGSFYSALREKCPLERILAAEGFEIDIHYGFPSQELWADTPLKIHIADFTMAKPPSTDTAKFNLIICNPPYVRHHHIINSEKFRLQTAAKHASTIRIGGLSGLYCYFMLLSHTWMTEEGIAGWLIPSEFMDVNYGKDLKRYLLTNVTLLRIHRFNPNEVQFGDALVSSSIVWFQRKKPPANLDVLFTFGGTLIEPKVSRIVKAKELFSQPKWTHIPVSSIRKETKGITLSDLFIIKRGLATGNNNFFILSQTKIKKYNLPMECFHPILPSPRYLPNDEIIADADGNPAIENQQFLLDCRLPEEEIKVKYPTLWEYLESGKPEVANRYLCRHRNPWYAQENRPAPLFICTYLGRKNTKRGRPFRFILNHSNATAANVYLLLYPKHILMNLLKNDPILSKNLWRIMNQIHPDSLLAEGRVYGGGLHKLEPRELGKVPAKKLLSFIPNIMKRKPYQMELFSLEVS